MVQGVVETVATELIDNLLATLPKNQEAYDLGVDLGDQAALQLEEAILPEVYERGSNLSGFLEEQEYHDFINAVPTEYRYASGIPLVGTITINPRQAARIAIPLNKFLLIQSATIDPAMEGLEAELKPRAEARIKNLATLSGLVGVVAGSIGTVAAIKFYEASR